MRTLRRNGRESESRPRVSDRVDLAAIGDCDASADDALTDGSLKPATAYVPP